MTDNDAEQARRDIFEYIYSDPAYAIDRWETWFNRFRFSRERVKYWQERNPELNELQAMMLAVADFARRAWHLHEVLIRLDQDRKTYRREH
jgi:hypothetical protein